MRSAPTCADEIAAAGLPVVLQFGEMQWWYFDNRALDPLGGMPFYHQETISAFAAAKGHPIGPFLSNTDDPAGDPAHPRGPGSNLPGHTLLEGTAGGELIIASGAGSGYRFAEIIGANNPSGWSACLIVKNPASVTA